MDSKIIYLSTIEKAGPLRWSNRRLARRVNRDLGEGRERLPTGSSEGEAGWENLRINRAGASESKDTENELFAISFKSSDLFNSQHPSDIPVHPVHPVILSKICFRVANPARVIGAGYWRK